MEMPLAQPAGVSEPPWILPRNNSMPVSRQLMPRIWLSPSPFTLLERPLRTSSRSLNGASGSMISLSLKSLPVSSGQKAGGIVPLGLNMNTRRWRGRAGLANPRLGSPNKNGRDAVDRPRVFKNSRRWRVFIIVLDPGLFAFGQLVARSFFQAVQRRNGGDFDEQILQVEFRSNKCLAQAIHGVRTISQHGLFDNMMKELLDEAVLGLFAPGGESGNIPRAGETDRLAFISGVVADGVDGLAALARLESAHGVKILKAEAQRIDHGMTALAGLGARHLGDLFAHREIRREVGVFENLGHGRRLERAAYNIASEKDSAMNRG